MTQIELPVQQPASPRSTASATTRVALLGNPNAGKTSLFNSLTGLRAKTANIPGTTIEHRIGKLRLHDDREAQLVDLPGLYSLEAVTYEERVARDYVLGLREGAQRPDLIVVVIDATNLERNLFLAGQVIELGRPTVVALNMYDLAERQGIEIDLEKMQQQVGCPVVPVSARTGMGLARLQETIADAVDAHTPPTVQNTLQPCDACRGCHYAARYNWAEHVVDEVAKRPVESHGQTTEAIDRILTHRVIGLFAFAGVMLGTFMLIFWLAQYPMGMVESLFSFAQGTVGEWLPEGDLQSFIVDGV
ncbi:MAG: 50S ribosome-binding GTPase, partial [Firmicutes bacterium]|nr:50S ribosome-binding GTPase [Bacillota bacterium]